jgi:ATP-dependent Clp protease ATP-binding subunit ClpB
MLLKRVLRKFNGFNRISTVLRSRNGRFNGYIGTAMIASGAASLLFSQYLSRRIQGTVLCDSEGIKDDKEDSASEILGTVKCDEPPDPVAGMNAYGWTPLHSACANGNYHEAEQIILGSLGEIDINAQDQFNFRIPGDLNEVSRIALQRQNEFRNLSFTTRTQGATALHYAMYSGNKKLVKLLFKHGADPTIKDDQALSPLDYTDDGSVRELFKELVKDFEELKRIAEKNLRKQFPLEKRLKEFIVGQDGPIGAVASAIRRRENGWHDEDRPLVFMFLGSSGIGKTELAKQVAKYIHKDDRKGFIRIDMSEFQTKHEVAKFIGSPPGYVGYEEGGQLTKKLKNSTFSDLILHFIDIIHSLQS